MRTFARISLASFAVLAAGGVGLAEPPVADQSFVYVTSQDDDAITQIDPGTLQKHTFAVSRGAVTLAPIAASRRLILVYPEAQVLKIVNTRDHAIEKVLPAAGQPFGLAYDSDTGHIFVGDWTGDKVSMIDIRSGKVLRQTKTGKAPAHIVLDGKDHRLFVCEREANTVGVFDSSTLDKIADIPVGRAPFAILYSAITGRVYVANVQSNDVSVIDAEKLNVVQKSVRVGSMPYGLAMSPNGKQLVVASQATNSVIILDPIDLTKSAEIAVGRYPEGVMFGPAGRLYVADWFGDAVSVVDVAKRAEIAKLPVGAGPRYLAVAN